MNSKDMMKMIVCDLSNKQCMFHRCSNRPGKENLILQLQQLPSFTEDSEIVFKQWESTDRANLNTLTLPADELHRASCLQDRQSYRIYLFPKLRSSTSSLERKAFQPALQLSWQILQETIHLRSKMKYKATTGTNNSALCIQLLCMQITIITFVQPFVSFLMTWVMTLDLFMLFKRFY